MNKKNRILTIILVSVLAAAVTVLLFVLAWRLIAKENSYKAAVRLFEQGRFRDAAEAFEALEDYKDSREKTEESLEKYDQGKYDYALGLFEQEKYSEAARVLDTIYYFPGASELAEQCWIKVVGEEVWESVKSIETGSVLKLGRYEQDANDANGLEDIEWVVLDKKGASVFLMSKYAIEVRPYHTDFSSISWKNCALRAWLNGDFYKTAFNAEERDCILLTENRRDSSSKYNTYKYAKTEDYVFLMSLEEVDRYLSDKPDLLLCLPTKHFIERGGYISSIKPGLEGHCWWMTRTPGETNKLVAEVCYDGTYDLYGRKVGYKFDAVRPAMWVDCMALSN